MNRSHSDSDEELSASGDPDELSDLSSSSGDDSSSNSSSSSTTDAEDSQPDSLELAKIENEVLRLPRGLCESAAIFHEFFSAETWNMLPEQFQARLQEHLPRFSRLLDPHEAATERQRTLELLFNGKLQRFGHTPLVDLQHQLEEGNCRPDVLQLRQSIAKSQRRELRFQHCERLSQLAKHLFVSRERLLRNAYKSTPDALLRAERSMRREKTALYADTKLCAVRARKRFRQDMGQMAQQLGLKADELSADEEDNGSGLEERERDLKIDLTAGLKTSSTPTDRCIYSTLFKRHADLADEEAVRANQLQQQQQQRLSNRTFRTCLREHKRRKLTEPSLPDFETSDIRLRDVCARAQMGNNFKHIFGVGRTPGRKPKSKVLPPNEPPALVPIQTPAGRQAGDENPAQRDEAADVSLGSFCAITTTGSAMDVLQQQQQHMHVDDNVALHAHAFMPEDGTPFNILDGEVELQQEEVETYRTSEETIPHFVISNEVVLPAIEQSDVPPQKLLQTPHKDDSGAAQQQQMSPVEESSQVVEQLSMPRLEPLSSIHKTPSRDKPRPQMLNYNSANNINVTPTRKPQPTGVNKSTAVASSYSAELIQETHSCFFSLIRDFFCATPNHRMQYEELRERIDVWLCNPITALNDWYAQADNWSALLTSAINFLAGEFTALPDEYVPYIEFKPQHNIYQWIGAGRDSDTRLSTLCSYWLQRRHEVPDKPLVGARQQRDATASVPLRRHSIEMEDGISAVYDGGVSPPPPPPPRYPTTWTVCAATPAEIAEFQRQERERFEQPHRAYTYRMHGYESVVGPVKGIYTQMLALTKARGHSMMVVNRPNFVTILTLVRDATARLPNGEGTRADIAELLKSSQYINLKEGENVLQTTVSGALDRMHTEHDPCVRYDPKRKIWIYLHRNRSEEEFERMHQQYQGLGKCKKGAVPRKPKTRPVQTKGAADGAEANGAGGPIESAVVSTSATPMKSATTFSLPALVPANPIIVNSQIAMGAQKPPPPVKQPLTKSLPVPPLKYNIPHQQQKSLLKSTLQTQRQQEHKSMEGAGEQQQQRIQGRNTAASNNAMSAVATAAASGKQFSFTMPSGKQANAVAAVANNTTPIIVATPTGLQTVHVSNANVVSAATLTSSAATMQLQPNSALSATVGGKKVALNKPIIINQITAQPVAAAAKAKSAAQHTLKQSTGTPQQPQQPHSFIIPISMASAVSGNAAGGEYIDGQLKETTVRQQIVSTANSGATTIYMDSSQLLTADNQSPQQSSPQQQHTKNIIRLVPAISSSSSSSSGGGGGGSKQPVHVIGHRMVTANTGTNVRPPQLQSKAIGGGITLSSAKSNNSAVVATTAGGSTLIKMSPQAFATLQQKQGPHILVKQHQQQQQPQQQQQQHHQRVIVGNTAIIAQSAGGQAAGKKVFMQQQSPLASAAHKTVATGSQTSSSLNISAGAASPVSNKIHTINASNLTPQQQRVLLQNLKQQQQQQQQQQQPHQQQQQIQFKTVQVMSNAAVQQSQQLEPTQSHVVARSQGVTVISQQQQHQLGAGATAQATQTAGKTVAVMVSQPQGLTRIVKQQQQTVSVSNEATQAGAGAPHATRVLTTSTGQIISLDSLLQKQGGTLKISGGAAATATKPAQAGAYVQQQVNAAAGGGTTYAVVTPARSNVITMGTSSGQRVISTQATLANTAESAQKAAASSGSGTGRIVMSSSGQLTMPQIAKVLSKAGAGAASATAAGGSNIRVIKSSAGAGGAASFNITNLQGKQVVFATKAPTAKNVVATVSGSQVQTQQLQPAGSVVLGGQTVKLQRNQLQQLNKPTGGINVITSQPGTQMQTVIMGNQILRVQQLPQQTVRAVGGHSVAQQRVATMPLTTVANSNNTPSTVVVNSNEALLNAGAVGSLPKTLVIGSTGQTIRLQQQQQPAQPLATQTQTQLATVKNLAQQATKSGNANRVVLAVQGGGQIFLSPNFQGNTLNLKSLQNMKVVSLGSRAVASADTQQQPEKTPATSTTATTVANAQQQSMLRSSGANNV